MSESFGSKFFFETVGFRPLMADEIKKNESEGSFWTFFEKKNLLDLGDQMGIKQLGLDH